MSLLLLFRANEGLLGVAAATLTLSAPDAVLEVDAAGIALDASPCELALSAPSAAVAQILDATPCEVTLSAPAATATISGVATINAAAAVLTLSTGPAGIVVDLTARIILINGVPRAHQIRAHTLTITDNLDEAPNTCMFVCQGFTPVAGQEIKVALGTTTNLYFAGHLTTVEQVYEGQQPRNIAYHCTAVDYTRLLDRRLVVAKYGPSLGYNIVSNIIGTFTSGFGTTNVALNLPATPEIEFTWEPVSRALTKLAKLLGAYWYVDYNRDVHFFLTETVDAPDPIQVGIDGRALVHMLTRGTETSQIRTRVAVEGGGSTAVADVPAGATRIPVLEPDFFRGGALAKTGSQRIGYSTLVEGGGVTTVRGVGAPGGAPSAALTAGAGGVLGLTNYRVSLKNSIGETVPGPAGNNVTGMPFAAPSSGPSVGPVAGVGHLAGSYSYAFTCLTARGETTLSPTANFTATAHATPGPPSVALAGGLGTLVGNLSYRVSFVTALGETVAGPATNRTAAALPVPGGFAVNNVGLGPLIGAYGYRVTFVTALGETTGGSLINRTASTMTAPTAPSVNATANNNGPLKGNYQWRVGFVTVFGETLGTPTGNVTVPATQASAPGIFRDGTGNKIDIRVAWLSPYGESEASPTSSDFNHGSPVGITPLGIPSDCTGWIAFSTGSYASTPGPFFRMPDVYIGTGSGDLGPGPGVVTGAAGTMGRKAAIGLPLGPTGVVARRLYRTRAGGTDFFLVAEIPNNSATSYTDATPDNALTAPAPFQNLNGESHGLSGIPTGPSGTVARRIYRTKAGGAAFFLVGELADNTTTSLTDNVPDAALTAGMPVVHTAGGEQHTITIPVGPTGTLARRLYRTKAGGVDYQLLSEIQNNSTPTYLDNTPDNGLSGGGPVLTSTAGGVDASVTIPAGPTGTTARNLYRTKASGGAYFLAAKVNGNSGITITDAKGDEELGVTAPTVNDAGASVVQVSSIPTGSASITARRLYRLDLAGIYRFVVELKDNTTTTYLDDQSDDELGDVAPTVSTIGAMAGDTTLLVENALPFPAFGGGWVLVGSLAVRYTGLAGTTLTGIPATGPGSIPTTIRTGTEVVAATMLTNIPASGPGALLFPIIRGDTVNVLVEINDSAAQGIMAGLEGGDGIHEYFLSDSRLTASSATSRAVAELAQYAYGEQRLDFSSRDPKLRSGKTITVNLGPPTNITGTFKIQTIVWSQWDVPHQLPLATVRASNQLYSFEHLLRRVELGG